LEYLIFYSGIICLDFDNVENLENVFKILSLDPYTYAIFKSPSGKGIKLLVKIGRNESMHNENYRSLQIYFSNKNNLIVDSKCKDIGRLCFLSYDPDIYVNESPKEFVLKYSIVAPFKRGLPSKRNPSASDIEKITQEIEVRKLDITKGYSNWLKLGFALVDAIGEQGRSYFHRLSRFHPDYNYRQTDKQFNKCLKSPGNGVTAKSFFFLAKEHGISVK
jgi:hypothetical protein